MGICVKTKIVYNNATIDAIRIPSNTDTAAWDDAEYASPLIDDVPRSWAKYKVVFEPLIIF